MNSQYQQFVSHILLSWQGPSRDGAYQIIHKYGLPNEATASRLIWYNNGPWKRTIIHRDVVPHHFPAPHYDYLQQFIDYRTPVDKFDDLVRYDGSVYPDRTGGEVSAKCDKEAMNILALNLFNEIVLGQRSIENARVFYAATAAKYNKEHISSPYTEGLLFPKQYHTADPDVSVI
jgi:hypothetical protein